MSRITILVASSSSPFFSNSSFQFNKNEIHGIQQILEIIGEKERISPSLLILTKKTDGEDKSISITSLDDVQDHDETTTTIQVEIFNLDENMKKVDQFFNEKSLLLITPNLLSLVGCCCVTCGEKIKISQPVTEQMNKEEVNKKPPSSPVAVKKAPVVVPVLPALINDEKNSVIQLPCGHFVHKNRKECMFEHKRNQGGKDDDATIRCSYCLSRWTLKWKRHHHDEQRNQNNYKKNLSANPPPPSSSSSLGSAKNTKSVPSPPSSPRTNNNNVKNNNNNNNQSTPIAVTTTTVEEENFEFAPWMMMMMKQPQQDNKNNISSLPKSLQRFFILQKCQLEGVNCQYQAVAVCDTHKSSSGGPALCDSHMKERHGYPECRRVDLSSSSSSSTSNSDNNNNLSMFFLPCPILSHRKNERRHFDLNRKMLVCSICEEEQEKQEKVNLVKFSDSKVREIANRVLTLRLESSTNFLNNVAFPALQKCKEFYQNVKINQKKQQDRLDSYSKKVNEEIDRQYACTKEILERQLKKLEIEYQNRKNEAREQFENTKKHLEQSDELSEPLEKILREGAEILDQVSERMTTIQIAYSIHPSLVAAKNAFVFDGNNNNNNVKVDEFFPSDFSSSNAFPKLVVVEKNNNDDDNQEEKSSPPLPTSFFLNQFISRPVPQLFGFSSFFDRNNSSQKDEEKNGAKLHDEVNENEIKKYMEKYNLKPIQEEKIDLNDDEQQLCQKISEVEWFLQNFQHEGCYLEREFPHQSSTLSLFSSTTFSDLLTCNKLGTIIEPTKRKEFKMKFSIEEMKKEIDEKCWGELLERLQDEEKNNDEDKNEVEKNNETIMEEKDVEIEIEDEKEIIIDDETEGIKEEIPEMKRQEETLIYDQSNTKVITTTSSSSFAEPNLYPPESLIVSKQLFDNEKFVSDEKILHPEKMPLPHPSFFATKNSKNPNNNNNDDNDDNDVDLLKSQLMSLIEEEKECLRRLRCWVVGWHDGVSSFQAQVFYDVASAREWYHSSLSNSNHNKVVSMKRPLTNITATRVIVSVETLQLIEEYFVDWDLRCAVLQYAEKKAEAVRSNVSLQLQIIRKKLAEFDV